MNKKTISNTFTVNTIIDGESAPYYFQEWFAWSNDPSTSSVITPPTISGSWATSIPAQGSYAYLWRKSIRYVWNESTRQYVGETAQYVRMSGTNGTSINTKGTIKVAITASGTFPTTGFSSGDLGIKQGDSYMWKFNGSSWSHVSSASSNGDSYTMTKDCTIDLDGDGTSENIKGHLIQWSTEASKWIDLGQFKGESGVTYYTHIAWATEVTLESSELPIPAGQTNRPNALAANISGFSITPLSGVSYAWMGYLIDTNSSDSQTKQNYTWQRNKGEKGNDASEVNPNILLRTIFDDGIDKVSEKWSFDSSYVSIDTASDTVVEGRKSIRLNSQNNVNGVGFSQSVLGKIKPNTWYTASFNVFHTAGGVFVMSFYNPIGGSRHLIYDGNVIVDGVARTIVADSCDVVINGSWDGARHTVTFKTRSSEHISDTELKFAFWQGYSSTGVSPYSQTAICMPKLEIGEVATAYMANEDDLRGEKGDQGDRGKVGRFFYFAGTFNPQDNDPTHVFAVNDAQAPYFEHTENGQKRYHVFNYDTNGTYTMAQMWAIRNNWNSKPWEVMTNDFKYIISEAIFGKYAHFGSAIINEDWLISGNGTINGALFKNGEEYNGVVAYTLFDPLFPYGIGNANVEINISEISWNYDSGNDIRAITDQYLLKAGRTYVVKILCHVERFYEGQQSEVYPKLLLWCPKDGVINDEACIGETDASKYEEDQIFQKTINPASDGLYDIRAGLETNTTYGYGYVEMVVFECQTNTMFVPQYCVDLLSGETSMAGGKVQANRHGDFIIKGALMYSSLSQDRFILTNIDSTTSPDTYTYNLAKGVYEGQILSPKIPANYININGNLNYNNKSIYMIYLPPARLFEGMEITIISNARASNDGSQLVPLTFRVPTDFNTIDPVLDDATATVASTWNRFAVLYDGGGKISEGADGGIGGTHLVTRNANVIKLIATKHPFIEYYHPSQNSARQEAYNKKCIAWCAVDVK